MTPQKQKQLEDMNAVNTMTYTSACRLPLGQHLWRSSLTSSVVTCGAVPPIRTKCCLEVLERNPPPGLQKETGDPSYASPIPQKPAQRCDLLARVLWYTSMTVLSFQYLTWIFCTVFFCVNVVFPGSCMLLHMCLCMVCQTLPLESSSSQIDAEPGGNS